MARSAGLQFKCLCVQRLWCQTGVQLQQRTRNLDYQNESGIWTIRKNQDYQNESGFWSIRMNQDYQNESGLLQYLKDSRTRTIRMNQDYWNESGLSPIRSTETATSLEPAHLIRPWPPTSAFFWVRKTWSTKSQSRFKDTVKHWWLLEHPSFKAIKFSYQWPHE